MTSKKTKLAKAKARASASGAFNYWQSAGANSLVFDGFRQQIINIALTRFEWRGLPETCDARFLEWALLANGTATICRAGNGQWYSTQTAQSDRINVYDNPTRWRSFGNGGWNIDVTPENGVFIWDNMARTNPMPLLNYYARELTDIQIAKRLNRQHQKVPFIFAGSQDQGIDMLNIYKQIDGGEPAIIGTDGISELKPSVFNTGVPYICDKLDEAETNVWQRIYTALGVQNLPFKQERQIEDEVTSQEMPASMLKLSPLTARREACAKLNERFERFIDQPISVVWRYDNQSDNARYVENVERRAEA